VSEFPNRREALSGLAFRWSFRRIRGALPLGARLERDYHRAHEGHHEEEEP